MSELSESKTAGEGMEEESIEKGDEGGQGLTQEKQPPRANHPVDNEALRTAPTPRSDRTIILTVKINPRHILLMLCIGLAVMTSTAAIGPQRAAGARLRRPGELPAEVRQ